MDVSDEHKDSVESKIVATIIANLEKGDLDRDEAQNIATVVLDRIDSVNTQEELLSFLRELSTRWRIFSNLLVLESGEIKEVMDEKIRKDALTLVKEGRIEDALKVAKTATE